MLKYYEILTVASWYIIQHSRKGFSILWLKSQVAIKASNEGQISSNLTRIFQELYQINTKLDEILYTI